MPNFRDVSGQKFGRLTVLRRAENDAYGHARWVCQCSCGKEWTAAACHLLAHETQSCGCLCRRPGGL